MYTSIEQVEQARRKYYFAAVMDKWLFYGGLRLRVLPLQDAHKQGRIHHDLLLQNTLALVTIHTRGPQEYTVEQVYMGVFDGQMAALAKTLLP